MSPRAILGIGFGIIAAGIFAVIGYNLFLKVDKVHQQNVKELTSFGSKVISLSSSEGDAGVTFGLEGGNVQLPPTLQQKKLSSTEKVILALSREKDALQIELSELTEKFDKQNSRLQNLRNYKAENERFAPEQLNQERERAQTILKEYFDKSSDVTQYKPFELDVMGLATANLYTEVVRQHQLILHDAFKNQLLKTLPQYGHCLGPDIPFIANDRSEERQLVKALREGLPETLKGDLGRDFKAIHEPCLKQLNSTINQLLKQHKAELAVNNSDDTEQSDHASNDSNNSGPVLNPGASPTEQLIQTLKFDKEHLLLKVKRLKETLDEQQQELGVLNDYQQNTERYAPLPPLEERNHTHQLMLDYFDASPDSERFNIFELEAMSLAAANQYATFNQNNRLIMTDDVKALIIQDYLPRYGFCFGDGLKFVINSRLQERQLINALRNQDAEYMGQSLRRQVKSITTPCATKLDLQLQALL